MRIPILSIRIRLHAHSGTLGQAVMLEYMDLNNLETVTGRLEMNFLCL